jgi:serine/threonine protein kinase
MNDQPPRSAPPGSDKATDTHGRSGESTGSRAVSAPGADPTTPRSPVPPAPGAFPQIDGYRVVEKIGEGGMGAVYLAEDKKLRRKVAIKTMRPELAANRADRDRFVREARAAAAVEHDYIVPIWHVGEAADHTPFIVMPFLRGEMLDSRLRREPMAPLWLLLKVAREVAAGLAAAHAEGLIHRDIKPGNIWLEGDPAAAEPGRQVRLCKILDFGLARSVDRDDTQITSTGAVLGTPAYMAPEQARGEKVDHRADLFSLGVALFRTSTGHAPFRGADPMSVLIALATETPPQVRSLRPDLPPELADLIDRLLQKDPNARPQSADEVADLVGQIMKTVQAHPPVQVAALPFVVDASSSMPRLLPVPSDEATVRDPWEAATAGEPNGDETGDERTDEAAPEPRRAGPARLLLLVAGGVALVGLFAWAFFVLVLATPEGTLAVEITDPDVEARYRQVRLVLFGPDGKQRYTLDPAERNKKIAAGTYTIRVEGADGLAVNPREFTLKKGDKVTCRVALDAKPKKDPDPKPKPEPKSEPLDSEVDRRAAERVLALGGQVMIDAGPEWRAQIPAGPFRVRGVDLHRNKQVTDADLALFKRCPALIALILWETNISDEGLVHVRECRGLDTLYLGTTRVTDAGLVHLADLPKVTALSLDRTAVTDAGLAHLSGYRALKKLLLFNNLQITDAGVAHFKQCEGLEHLDLTRTGVGDAGLALFSSCRRLTDVLLIETRVTAGGVAAFAKALPRCKIVWDGRVIEPTAK